MSNQVEAQFASWLKYARRCRWRCRVRMTVTMDRTSPGSPATQRSIMPHTNLLQSQHRCQRCRARLCHIIKHVPPSTVTPAAPASHRSSGHRRPQETCNNLSSLFTVAVFRQTEAFKDKYFSCVSYNKRVTVGHRFPLQPAHHSPQLVVPFSPSIQIEPGPCLVFNS